MLSKLLLGLKKKRPEQERKFTNISSILVGVLRFKNLPILEFDRGCYNSLASTMFGFSAIASSGRFEPFAWRAASEKNDALLKRRSPSLPWVALLGSDTLKRLPLPKNCNKMRLGGRAWSSSYIFTDR